MDMLLLRTFVSMVAVIIASNYEPCFGGCARAEYEINGECCPMCAPGNCVYWHCTVDTSTTCVPCPASTFTDEPNGLTKCFPCTVCDTVNGLKIHKACIRSADTICEPQERFYCIKPNKGSCELAAEHSKCKPGQYIKHMGTALRDTECADCTDGTYSNGSVMACLPHSKCEVMGLKEKKAGTASSDTECEKGISVGLIVGVTFTILVVAVALSLLVWIVYRKRTAQQSKKDVSYTSQPTEDDETAHQQQQPWMSSIPDCTPVQVAPDDQGLQHYQKLPGGCVGSCETSSDGQGLEITVVTMRTTFIRISILLAFCTFPGSGKDCGPSEYESAAGECCPMCSSGYIVRSDCNGDSSTTCKPCAPETFMNEPNGIYNCFQCRKCAEDLGLYTKSKCTTIQDTFCDVLDGYYCLALSNSQCSHAVKHSVCKAGQETKTQGTKTSDTVCVDCAHGFYSPSGLTCIKWTDCTALNEIQTENGTSVKDVTCITKTRGRHGLIYGLPVAVLVTLLFFIFSHQFSPSNRELPIRKKDFPCPIQETNPASTTQSTNILEERNRDQK